MSKSIASGPWEQTTETIAGRPCLKHKGTGELGIFGERGEVWVYSETDGLQLGVIVRDKTFAQRYFPAKGNPEGERLGVIPAAALEQLEKDLLVPTSIYGQLRIANARA